MRADNRENTTNSTIPAMLDWRQACQAIGGAERPISRATLDRLTRAGLLRVRRPGPGVVRWAAEDIAEYLDSVSFPPRTAEAA